MFRFMGLVIELFRRLKIIPGLGFLGSYELQLGQKIADLDEKMDQIEIMKHNTTEGAKALKEFPASAKGSKKRI